MSATEVINDLNVVKLVLLDPQMLTPAMCIRIGQTATSAINLLKEQEELIDNLYRENKLFYCADGKKRGEQDT